MSEKEIRLDQNELISLCARAFEAMDVPSEGACDAAEILVLAEMMGITTHGVRRVVSYGERINSGGIDARAPIKFDGVAPTLIKVDGGNGLGPAIAAKALRLATQRAKEFGIAAAFCRHSNHFGAVAPYCWLSAEQGLATIVMSNSTPLMAPAGGSEARVGNNPLGFGFPDQGGKHVIFDIAMSMVSRSRIRHAAETGEPIPQGWAVDQYGQPTQDASEALKGLLMPMGGHKGYGISLCVDMLAGFWSGAAFLSNVVDLAHVPNAAQNLGQAFIVIDIKRLLSAEQAQQRMVFARADLSSCPPVDPETPVRMPGERAITRLKDAMANGIPLSDATLSQIQKLGELKC